MGRGGADTLGHAQIAGTMVVHVRHPCRQATRTGLLTAALLACVVSACGDQSPERGDNLDRQLLAAAYRNDVSAARTLVADGADVNDKDGSEQSAYLIATSEIGDDPRRLELTLDAGADANLPDKAGTTPPRTPRERDFPAIERILRQAGAKP